MREPCPRPHPVVDGDRCMPTEEDKTPLAEAHAAGGTALLIMDMLSDWQCPQGEELLNHAAAIAPRIADLKARCRQAGVPVVYVNDNRGRWRSDFRGLIEYTSGQQGEGARVAWMLYPGEHDYCVLKPRDSGFYATPLELLLRHLRVGQVILTGVATERCIAMTATDATVRDFKVWCPEDAVASHSGQVRDLALAQLRETTCARTGKSDTLRLPHLDQRSRS